MMTLAAVFLILLTTGVLKTHVFSEKSEKDPVDEIVDERWQDGWIRNMIGSEAITNIDRFHDSAR